jgi:transcriptional regulator with XRE-family HTH domain
MRIASIRQVKAARALLGWSQAELAKRSGISEPTIKRLEATDSHDQIGGRPETATAIQSTLEAAGVEFTHGGESGVRLKKTVAAIEAVTEQIEALEEKVADIPVLDGPSPEAAINVMDKAVAENDLTKLKNRRTRLKGDRQK